MRGCPGRLLGFGPVLRRPTHIRDIHGWPTQIAGLPFPRGHTWDPQSNTLCLAQHRAAGGHVPLPWHGMCGRAAQWASKKGGHVSSCWFPLPSALVELRRLGRHDSRVLVRVDLR
jgi:hypothetical protein